MYIRGEESIKINVICTICKMYAEIHVLGMWSSTNHNSDSQTLGPTVSYIHILRTRMAKMMAIVLPYHTLKLNALQKEAIKSVALKFVPCWKRYGADEAVS